MNNKIDIDAVIINGTTYIPCRNVVNVLTEKEPVKADMEIVYMNKSQKLKQKNREYYLANKHKWKKYDETKKQKAKDMQSVIEFY